MATQSERIAEVMAHLSGGSVNLKDAGELARLTGLPEALVAQEPEYVRRLIFEDRLARDADLLLYAGQDGARAKIAFDNADAMRRLGRIFERVHAAHRYEQSILTMPKQAINALLAAENEVGGVKRGSEAKTRTDARSGEIEPLAEAGNLQGGQTGESPSAVISGAEIPPSESGEPQSAGADMAGAAGSGQPEGLGNSLETGQQETDAERRAQDARTLFELQAGSVQERASRGYLEAAQGLGRERGESFGQIELSAGANQQHAKSPDDGQARDSEISTQNMEAPNPPFRQGQNNPAQAVQGEDSQGITGQAASIYDYWQNPFARKLEQSAAEPVSAGLASGSTALDYWLDPFRNFANGFLDCARAVMGSGQALGELVAGPQNGVSRWFANWVKSIEKAEFRTRRPEGFGAQLMQDVVRNTPQVIFQLAAAMQSLGLSTAFMFDQIFGLDYARHRAKGISPENAAFSAAVDAALQSALERVGIGYILGKGTGGILGSAAGKGSAWLETGLQKLGAKAPKTAALAYPLLSGARAASVEAVTEAAQNAPDYLSSYWADSSLAAYRLRDRAIWTARQAVDLKNLMRGTKDALYEGLIGGIIGGGIGTGHHVIEARRQLAAEEQRLVEESRDRARNVMQRLNYEQVLEEARKIIAESPAANDPAALYELMRAKLDLADRMVWLDPGAVRKLSEFGHAKTEDMAMVLELTVPELQAFMAGNMSMQADMARLLSWRHDASLALQDISSLTVDGPALEEARLWNPDQAIAQAALSFNQDEDEEEYFDAPGSESFAIGSALERRRQQTRVNGQLARLVREMESAGLTPLEARTHIRVIEAHVLANYKNYGVDPLAWLESLAIGGENAIPRKPEGRTGFVEDTAAEAGLSAQERQARLIGRMVEETDKKLVSAEIAEFGAEPLKALLALYEGKKGRPQGGAQRSELEALSFEEWANLRDEYLKGIRDAAPGAGQILSGLTDAQIDAMLRLLELEGGLEEGTLAPDELYNMDALELEELAGRVLAGSRTDETQGAPSMEDSGQPQNGQNETGQTETGQEESGLEGGAESAGLPGSEIAGQWAEELAYPEQSAEPENGQAEIPGQEMPQDGALAEDGGIAGENGQTGTNGQAEPGTANNEAEWWVQRPGETDSEYNARLDREMDAPRQGESWEDYQRRLVEFWNATAGDGLRLNQTDDTALAGELDLWDKSQGSPRGQAQITETTRLVKLFSSRNLSTMTHESGHIFVDDLIRIVAAGGNYGLESFIRNFARVPGAATHWAALRKALAANPGNGEQALRVFAEERANGARENTGQIKRAEERLELLRKNGQFQLADGTVNPFYAALEASLGELSGKRLMNRRLARLARMAASHYEAVNQARDDLKTLAAFAKISEEQLADIIRNRHVPGADNAALVRLQETAARAFEQYFMEGKSPSLKLRDIMRRLSSWLTRLYQNCRHLLGADISPEVSEVFDRMLSTAQERDLFGQMGGMSTREEQFLNNPAISADERRKMRELLRRMESEAPLNIERQLRKRRQRFAKERQKAIFRKLENDPFWKLAEEVKFTRDEINEFLGEKMGPALAAAAPRLLGKRPESLGEIVQGFGYQNAAEMFNELYTRLVAQGQTRRGLAEELAAQEIAELEKADKDRAALAETDELGTYLDFMDKATARIIASMHFKTEEEIRKFAEQTSMPRMFIESRADVLMQSLPIRSATAARFQLMLKKALKRRDELLASRKASDLMAALEQVQQARVAVQCLDNLRIWQDMQKRFIKKVVRIRALPAGKIGALQTEALRKLFTGFRLGNMQATEDPGIAQSHSLRSMVQEIAGDGGLAQLLPIFPDWLLDFKNPRTGESGKPVDWRDLTYDELLELGNLADWLYKGGRQNMRDRKEKEKRLVRNIALFCAQNMNRLPAHKRLAAGSWRANIQGLLEGMAGNVDLLQWQALKADGLINVDGKGAPGAFEQLYIKVLKAEENVKGWLHRAGKDLEPHLKELEKCRRRLEKKFGKAMNIEADGKLISPPASWQKAYHSDRFTPEMIIAMALHLGSDSNAQRLHSGYYRFNEEEFKETFSALFGDSLLASLYEVDFPRNRKPRNGVLEASEWRAIQGIWDTLSMFWADTAKTHEKMFGFVPPRVQAKPLQILAADGALVNLAGGYFPCRYDPRIEDKVGRWTEKEFFLDLNQSIYNRPTAKRGHTISRTKAAPGLPLKLDLSPIQEHIVNAARFIEYGELANRIDAVISAPEFQSAYENAYGQEDYQAIRPNIRGLVRTPPCENVWDRLVEAGRGFVAVNGLALNLRPALLQLTAVFPAMADLGAGQVAKSICWMMSHGLSGARQIWKSSPYMLSRLKGLDASLRRQLRQFTTRKQQEIHIAGKSFIWEDLVEFGMKLIISCDAMATLTVWHAAYNLKLKQLREHGMPADPFAQFMEEQREKAARERQEAGLKPQALNQEGEDKLPDFGSGENAASFTEDELPGKTARHINLNPFSIFRPLTDNLTASGKDAVSESDPYHYEAARFADRMVKRSNPDYDAPSRSAFLRDKGIAQLINQFASAQVLFASRNRFLKTARQKKATKLSDSARENFYTYGLTSLSILLVFGMLQGYDPKREPDDAMKFLVKATIDQLSMKLPGYAQLVSPVLGPALGLDAGFSRGISTVLDTPINIAKNLGKAAGLVWKDNVTDQQKRAAILSVIDFASLLARVPVGPIIHRAERGQKQLDKGKGTPLSLIMPR